MLATQMAISAKMMTSITIGWLVSAWQRILPVKIQTALKAGPITRLNSVASAFLILRFVACTQSGRQTLKFPHRSRKVSSECKTDQVTGASATKKSRQNSAEMISTGTSSPVSACQMFLAGAYAHPDPCWTQLKIVVLPHALEFQKSMRTTILFGPTRWTSKMLR